MNERQRQYPLPPEREDLFWRAEKELAYPAEIYSLGRRFEGLRPELAKIVMLDTTQIPGCHYGAKNVFVPIIHHLEKTRSPENSTLVVSPDTAILVESSTGNGWVAFSDAAEKLNYEHIVIMPDGLPEARYKHPQGRKVRIIRTPKEEYAEGLPKKLAELMGQNRQRFKEGEKIYVSTDHAVNNADITAEAMSDLGRQLVERIGFRLPWSIRIVISMGNGASLCAIGEYVRDHSVDLHPKIVATESFAYGNGYERFAQKHKFLTKYKDIKDMFNLGLASYRELFSINPANPTLMAKFSTFGTNAPIGIELPLQTRAINTGLIDDYVLFIDEKVLQAYKTLNPNENHLKNALALPNYSNLPAVLTETYGNSTLANIAVASLFTKKYPWELVIAIAYDSRKNY